MAKEDVRTRPERLRYQRVSAEAQRLLATEGESGRFEFKRDAKSIHASDLVGAANWVALEPVRDHVTILVGVDEVTDETTGLTHGQIYGLPGELAAHARRLQNLATSIQPVAVRLRIIEEGVATRRPFLRVEVRPTFPPHFDGRGSRVTRDGATTRALQDEELLALYMEREAAQFQARFTETAASLLDSLETVENVMGAVAEDVARIPGLISGAEAAAMDASSEADTSTQATTNLAHLVEDLGHNLSWNTARTPVVLFVRLRHERRRVWRAFTLDSVERPSAAADRIRPKLRQLLEEPVDPDQALQNLLEADFWEETLESWGRPSPMTWWTKQLRRAGSPDTAALMKLPDEQAIVQAHLDAGGDLNELELPTWTD